MNRSLFGWQITRYLVLGSVALLTMPITGQPPESDRTKREVVERPVAKIVQSSAPVRGQPDLTKTLRIEPPVERIVRESATVPRNAGKPVVVDPGKGKIEFPTKSVLPRSGPPDVSRESPRAVDDTTNPTVKAGLVQWHPSFAKACEAAKVSGKAVLLFHMMGQLDKQFC
jgi:hypothetical protein